MKTIKTILLMTLAVIMLPSFSNAQSAQSIMEKVYHRKAPESGESDMTMTLINSRGNKRVRSLHQFFLDDGKTEKKIMFFKSPADVKNTSFMNWSYESDKDDDQWLYLPALRKVKRISGDNKGDRFMGSDFTYDDMGERKPDEDTHQLLKTEKMNGKTTYVIESVPKNNGEVYSKTITWVVKDKWYGLKKEYYDQSGKLLKVLTNESTVIIDGFLIVKGMKMKNVQKSHSTLIELDNIKVNTGITDRKFTQRMMERGL